MSFKRFRSQLTEMLSEFPVESTPTAPEKAKKLSRSKPEDQKTQSNHSTQQSNNRQHKAKQLNIELKPEMSVSYLEQEQPVFFINTAKAQEFACQSLRTTAGKYKTLYIDLEFENKQGVKGAVPALMQISAGTDIYVIDLLECELSDCFKSLLSDQEFTWVLHDAREDIKLLVSRYLIKPPARLFDTQVAWGFCSIEPTIGLAALCYSMHRVQANKTLQIGRFLNRPLSADLLQYAAEDIPPLIALVASFKQRLNNNLIEAIYEESKLRITKSEELYLRLTTPEEELEQSEKKPRDPLFKFRKKLWMLSPQQYACLQAFLTWNPEIDFQRSPVSWPQQKLLFNLAQLLPKELSEFSKVQGLDPLFIQRYGDDLINMVHKVLSEVPEHWSEQNEEPWTEADRPSFSGEGALKDLARQRVYYHWSFLLITSLSAQLAIAPQYICPEHRLKKLSQDCYSSPEMIIGLRLLCMESWRAKVLLSRFEELLKQYKLCD